MEAAMTAIPSSVSPVPTPMRPRQSRCALHPRHHLRRSPSRQHPSDCCGRV